MNIAANETLKGARVLIAEDNAILAFDMLCNLRTAGAETLGPARTLKEALRLAQAAPLHCGILDVSLYDDLVFPAAQVLRDRHIGIVFYTGYHDAEGLKRDWPEAQVLSKPAPLQLLVQTVCAACGDFCLLRH